MDVLETTVDDLRDAAGLLKAGNAPAQVMAWTGLTAAELAEAKEYTQTTAAVPSPPQIADRAAGVRANWSTYELRVRAWGGRSRWQVPRMPADETLAES